VQPPPTHTHTHNHPWIRHWSKAFQTLKKIIYPVQWFQTSSISWRLSQMRTISSQC